MADRVCFLLHTINRARPTWTVNGHFDGLGCGRECGCCRAKDGTVVGSCRVCLRAVKLLDPGAWNGTWGSAIDIEHDRNRSLKYQVVDVEKEDELTDDSDSETVVLCGDAVMEF